MSFDFQRLERVLAEAAAKGDAKERAAYLAQVCGDDAELRAEVERLLAAHEKAGDFLETPFQPIPDKIKVVSESDITIERSGAMIGRYKLLEEIGEGGFGVVYMAEQAEPVQRKVALKIIKAGMDTREVVARFEAERQALALMDHPNIAKVFDGGATQTGRPYFVMELVRGIAITEFCDQRKLSTKERLRLFIQVCQAVQHAHQKGVIHRDLKPSNILVTLVDGEPVPKIIDFGVAKALGQKLTEKTLFTGFLKMVGTPAYMSPEQADLSGVDIDTRADIYALGVLLYELLTGVTPFSAETLHNAGLDEIRWMLRETEPPKPSTRLRTLGQKLTEVAKHRQTEPTTLSRLVRGDLDWIVMKCLEKDRRRRYETADSLADDVERHLEDQPVSAGPPGMIYRVGKFVRRHRMGVALGASVGAALVLGLVAALGGFTQARHERDRAEASARQARIQAAKATAISDFLQEMLRSANPESAKGRDYTVRQMLDDFSEGLGDRLKDQPEVEAAVRTALGKAYWRLGLGDKAQPHLERALELKRRVFGEQSEQAARSLIDYAWNLQERDQMVAAEDCTRQALSIYRERGCSPQLIVSALWTLERTLSAQSRYAEAETCAEEALAQIQKAPGLEFPELPAILHELAFVNQMQGRLVEAEQLARKAVVLHRRLQGDKHLETAWGLLTLGNILEKRQDYAGAEASLREALQIFHWNYGADHREIESVLSSLVPVLIHMGKGAGAETLLRQELARRRESLGDEHPGVATMLQSLGEVLRDSDNVPEAEAAFREALTIRRQALGAGDPLMITTVGSLTELLKRQRKLQEAADLLRKELTRCEESLGSEHGQLNWHYGMLAGIVWSQGKLSEAENLFRQSLRLQRRDLPAGNPYVAASIGYIDALLRAQGKLAEAETLHREELARLRGLVKDGDVSAEITLRMAEQMAGLGLSLRDRGNFAEAAATFRDALTLYKKIHAEKDPAATDSLLGLVTVLIRQGKPAEAKPLVPEAAEAGNPAILNGAAWLLATHADSKVRNGEMAVHLAEAAVSKTGRTNAMYLDTLAAAYAADSQFTNASNVQKEAVALLTTDKEREDYTLRLKLYLDGIPYRETGSLATRALTLLKESKFVEAEPLARECLALREAQIPDSWLTFNARSLLGSSLLGQKKYAEAKPLLLSGYRGIKERESQIPAQYRPIRLKEALQRLVEFYQATGQPEKAAQWWQKLTQTDKSETSKQAGTP